MAEFVNPVGKAAVDKLIDSTSTQFGYIWNYKRNFESLENQHQRLQARKEVVEHLVADAKRNREEIERQVVNWLDRVNTMIDEVAQVIDDNKKAQMKCLKSLCPDLKKRYQHSKNAMLKAKDVSELCDENFDRISYRTVPEEIWLPSSKPYEELESRLSILTKVMDELKHTDVTMVGIHGMGGVGKTTLARGVAKNAQDSKLFDSVVFAEVSKQLVADGLHDINDEKIHDQIRDQIADQLGLKFKATSRQGRASELIDRLKKTEKILLIVDNIWKELHWHEIGIPLNNDHKGCKVLLTARDRNVLEKMNCQKIFNIEILNEEEAWTLFKKIAGFYVEDPRLGTLPSDVAKSCCGLPVAIVTTAQALKGKEIHVWENALQQLDRTTFSCVQFSYDQLESEDLRMTFLLCCAMILINKASLDTLLRYGFRLNSFQKSKTMEAQRNHVLTSIDKLKGSSLLLENGGDKSFSIYDLLMLTHGRDKSFSIHDLVLECGKEIAEKQNYFFVNGTLQPSQRSLLENLTSIFLIDMAELSSKLNCPNLTFFYLKSKTGFSLPSNYFQTMRKLKIVHLEGLDLMELPTSLNSLEELGALYLESCNLGDISMIGDIETLENLTLCDSQRGQMILPEGIGNLKWLRLLDLTRSSFIIPPGIISKLTRLEELYLEYWYDQWLVKELAIESSVASVEELKELCCLTALHIRVADTDAEVLLKSIDFQKLQSYQLVIGDKTKYTYHRETCRFLIAEDPSIECIMESMLPSTRSLKILHLRYLVSLEKIFHDQVRTSTLCQLRSIKVEGCHKLKYVFPLSIVKHLSLLEEIEVASCHNIEVIFMVDRAEKEEKALVSLEQLCSLKLRDLPRLKRICSRTEVASNASSGEIVLVDQLDSLPLFGEKVVFPNLKDLKLLEINVKRIWSSQLPCWVQKLTKMVIGFCNNLEHVFLSSTLSIFKHLQQLQIYSCKSLEELVRIDGENNTCVEFPSLESLQINGGHGLRIFIFNNKVLYPNLREIRIECMDNLKSIWHPCFISRVDQYMPKLCKVGIRGCRSLENIFPTSHVQSFLQVDEVLSMSKCEVKENVVPGGVEVAIMEFPSLEHLEISWCADLKEFIFNDKVSFPNLCEIKLNSLNNLRRIWHPNIIWRVEFWTKLCKMDISYCESLEYIFPTSLARRLFQLEVLNVNKCGVKEIVAIQSTQGAAINLSFPQLTSLSLQDLPQLSCFYPGKYKLELPKLKMLEVVRCKNVDDIFCFQNQDVDDPTWQKPLFLVDQAFPHLEKMALNPSQLRSISLSSVSEYKSNFPLLEYLQVYDLVLHIVLEKFHFLKKLEIFDCSFRDLSQTIGAKELPQSSFFQDLKILKVSCCNEMMSLLPASAANSLMVLEVLSVEFCQKVAYIIKDEEDMECEITLSRLKSLKLMRLINLASFYSGNCIFSFPLLETLDIDTCSNFMLFSSRAYNMPKLQQIKLRETIFGEEKIYRCKDHELNRIITNNKIVSATSLAFKNMKSILESEEVGMGPVFSKLETLSIRRDEISWLLQGRLPHEVFPNLSRLEVIEDESTSAFPLAILDKLHTVKDLRLISCSCEEIFASVDIEKYMEAFLRIKYLYLRRLQNLKRLWEHNSILQNNIAVLVVESCDNLGTLMPPSSSFQNLKELHLDNCDGLVNLFRPTTAQTLVQLLTLQISHCKMMETILSYDEEVVRNGEIIFKSLWILNLYNLSSFTSFCSQNYTFTFPALSKFAIGRCPRMNLFSSGILHTPRLYCINCEGREFYVNNNLNTFVQEVHAKQNVGTSSQDCDGPSSLPSDAI